MPRYIPHIPNRAPDIRADMVQDAMIQRGFKDAANNLHDRWAHYNEYSRAYIFKAWFGGGTAGTEARP